MSESSAASHHLEVQRDPSERLQLHPWFAVRPSVVADITVELTADPSRLAAFRVEDARDGVSGHGRRFLDLCAGVGTIAEAAARRDYDAVAIDLNPVATLIARARLDYPSRQELLLPGAAWNGLSNEVRDAAERVLTTARSQAAREKIDDFDAIVAVRLLRCPSCHAASAAVPAARLAKDLYVATIATEKRGTVFEIRSGVPPRMSSRSRACPACGAALLPAQQPFAYWPAAQRTATGSGWEWTALPSSITEQEGEGAGSNDALFDGVFTTERGRQVSWRDATSPRQQRLIHSLVVAARAEEGQLADRGLPVATSEAVGTFLALLVSASLPLLTRATDWNALTSRPRPALARQSWLPGRTYAEVGLRHLEEHWAQRVREALDLLDRTPGRPVHVRNEDARRVLEQDESYDLIVWDPPFYDNVDYEALAAPFEQVCRRIGPNLPDLVDRTTSARGQFDPNRYQDDIRAMASEAHRLLRGGGHIGVWWTSRTAAQLQEFVDLIADVGLELRSAVWVDTEIRIPTQADPQRAADRPRNYLLVFQKVMAVAPVDAAVVLALADADRPSLYEGLATILESEYSSQELDVVLPPEFRGNEHDRVVEYVATHPRPDELLVELGRRALRAHAEPLGIVIGAEADVREAARLVLAGLGFSMPHPPLFSAELATDALQRLAGDIRLGRSPREAKPAFDEAEQLVLRSLRLAVLAWAALMPKNGESALGQIVTRTGGRFRGLDLMSFGDWKSTFCKLPAELAERSSPLSRLFDAHRRSLKGVKAVSALDRFVSVRNRLAHPDDREVALEDIIDAVDQVAQLFPRLLERQVLPVVLEPQEERRDRWGRRLLVALDGRGRTREMVVSEPADLTRPLVWVPREVNPREVNPILVTTPALEGLIG